jgi:hypothetical protein
MGLFDGILGYFGALGQQAGQIVTAPYSGGGPAAPSSGGSVPTQQAPAPQPIQINPIGAITGWGSGALNYVGSGITNISSGIQTFIQPVAQPMTQAIQSAPLFIAAPITAPVIIGSAFIGGVQSFLNPPVQQQITSLIFSSGAGYTPITINPITNTPSFNPQAGMSIFVPGGALGDQSQIQVNNLNAIAYDPVGGGWIGTTVPYGHSISNIITGGGPGSLQSGMFTTKPNSPAVYTQESVGTVFAPTADLAAAALLIANPSGYSRLGAERYGGTVSPLVYGEAGKLQPGTQMGVYPASSGNLANLVNPYGVNQPKSTWAEMPWNTPVMTTPGIFAVSSPGATGTYLTPVSQRGLESIGWAAPVSASLPANQATMTMGGGVVPGVVKERNFLDQLNYDIGGFLGIRASGLEQTGGVYSEATAKRPFISTYAGNEQTPFEKGLRGGFLGGLIGYELFGENRQEVIKGALYSGADVVTSLVGWTPFKNSMQAPDPQLAAFRAENTRMKATATPEEYNAFLQTSYDKGILVKQPGAATLSENPELTYDYGQFTKWGMGAGTTFRNTFLGGASIAQVKQNTYNEVQSGDLARSFVAGTGEMMSTHPEKFISGYIGGAAIVGGGMIVGGMYEGSALATRAGAYALSHPTIAAVGSKLLTYGIPVGLGALTYYGVSEGFTASPAQTAANTGMIYPELVGVVYGGASAYAATRAIDAGYLGYQTRKEVYLPGWERTVVGGELTAKGRSPLGGREITIDATGKPIVSVVGNEPLTVPTIKQVGEGMIFPRESELNLANPPRKTVLDFRPPEADTGMFSTPDVRNVGDVIFRPETSKGFTNIGTKTFTTENFAASPLDVAPIPSDIMPGVKFQAGRSAEGLPLNPQEAMFGLQVKIEPVFQPKGIGMPTGSSQVMANPEILSGTRSGTTISSIDAIMETNMKYSAYKKTASQAQVESVIPKADFVPKATEVGNIESILKSIQESEKRAPVSSTWKPVEAKNMGFGEYGPQRSSITRTTQLPSTYNAPLTPQMNAPLTGQSLASITRTTQLPAQAQSPLSITRTTQLPAQLPAQIPASITRTTQLPAQAQTKALITGQIPAQITTPILSQTPAQRPMQTRIYAPFIATVAATLTGMPNVPRTIPERPFPDRPWTPYTPPTDRPVPERPWVPYTPTPNVPVPRVPVPVIPLTPFGFPGFSVPGSGGGGGNRKRRGAFTEIFNMGLDYSLKRPSKRQGKSWAQPKKIQKARAAAKKGGKKK